MLLQFTTIALVWASGSALPEPGATTQYVFLAPQVQRFAVQSAFKYPPQVVRTVFPTVTNINPDVVEKSTVQYAYTYPQYNILRQDEQSWLTGFQNFFQCFGGGGGGGDETDAPVRSPAIKADFNVADANKDKFVAKSDNFLYLTPTSTTVLNPERRFFILPEQQKFGSINTFGPASNPVFSLQPLVSRSPSSSIVAAEPAVVVPDNGVSSVQPSNFLKSHIQDGLKAAAGAPHNRVAPVNDWQTRFGVEVNDEGLVINSLPAASKPTVAKNVQTKQLFEPVKEPQPPLSTLVAPDNTVALSSRQNENAVIREFSTAKQDATSLTAILASDSLSLDNIPNSSPTWGSGASRAELGFPIKAPGDKDE